MTFFTGLACRTRLAGTDRKSVCMEDHRNHLTHILGFPRNLGAEDAPPNVTLRAVDIGMRRNDVSSILGRHSMAGISAETGGIGVIPPVDTANNHYEA